MIARLTRFWYRVSGEPLEEYILPEGGGFFFTLPGVTTDDGYLGQELLES